MSLIALDSSNLALRTTALNLQKMFQRFIFSLILDHKIFRVWFSFKELPEQPPLTRPVFHGPICLLVEPAYSLGMGQNFSWPNTSRHIALKFNSKMLGRTTTYKISWLPH